jgi:hypothetical protein
MSTWLVWAAFLLVALMLGLVGYHFSLRTLRVCTAATGMAVAVYVTWYGLTQPAKTAGGLAGAFARGADALGVAFFRAVPGQAGWIVIAALLAIGYRQLEAWALHNQARSLDTSALAGRGPDADPGGAAGQDAVADKERLSAELKFRLPAVQVRAPAILPGGSRAGGLASIAETSGFAAGGLAGAIINFFGMLWPGPRRLRVQVWVEQAPADCPGSDDAAGGDAARVTVDLDDPRTGLSIATKTLTACCIDHAASVVAGYVARSIFAEDRTAPPWCTSAADGRDLAALLIARQVRDYPESMNRVIDARNRQIQILEGVAHGTQCAGVTRYELAQLYDLTGEHVEALLIHAINREQYPDFYRGRYRLAMSLEMLSQPGRTICAAEASALDEALTILHRCGVLPACLRAPSPTGQAEAGLPLQLQAELLDAAWDELHDVRRYLSLPNVLWRSFWCRDERGVLKPYWRQPYRQAFHDGVGAALLLVAVRRKHVNRQLGRPVTGRPPRARTILRIAAAITGDGAVLARELGIQGMGKLKHPAPPVTRTLRTRHWFRPDSTRSWQAGYNLACAYAAVAQAQASQAEGADQEALRDLTNHVVSSLWFTVCDPQCEMERPWDWIFNDPDFSCLKDEDQEAFRGFRDFLDVQERRDYPSVPRPHAGRPARSAVAGSAAARSAAARRPGRLAEAAGPVADPVEQLGRGDDLELRA